MREQRLYQTDYLLRDYGFMPSEVVYDENGNLPLENDPKTSWALAHPEHFPMEVRTASREQLDVVKVLLNQQTAWNHGDLDAFVQDCLAKQKAR